MSLVASNQVVISHWYLMLIDQGRYFNNIIWRNKKHHYSSVSLIPFTSFIFNFHNPIQRAGRNRGHSGSAICFNSFRLPYSIQRIEIILDVPSASIFSEYSSMIFTSLRDDRVTNISRRSLTCNCFFILWRKGATHVFTAPNMTYSWLQVAQHASPISWPF